MVKTRYSVHEEIKETTDSFYRALSTRSLKALDGIWAHASYAAVAGSTGQLHQGWDDVCRYWQQRFQRMTDLKVSVRLMNFSCHAVGDVAWVSGTERRTMSRDGEEWSEDLRMTCVLERASNGWLIVQYHASAPREEAATLASAS